MTQFLKRAFLTIFFALVAAQASAMFIQPDWFEPTQPGVGTNRYSYCHNDPINCIDPSGNEGWDLFRSQEGSDQANRDAADHARQQAEEYREKDTFLGDMFGDYWDSRADHLEGRTGKSWGERFGQDVLSGVEHGSVFVGGGVAVQGGRAIITRGGAAAASREVAKKAGKEFFKDGELFEWAIDTSKGTVRMLAETSFKGKNGRVLSLDNVTVFADAKNPLTGLSREMVTARTQLANMARQQGFKSMSLSYTRVPTSTSANPGKTVNLVIDLLK